MLSFGTLKSDRMLAICPSTDLFAEESDYLFFYFPQARLERSSGTSLVKLMLG
jgi:hypothetical protein